MIGSLFHREIEPLGDAADFLPERGRISIVRALLGAHVEPGRQPNFLAQKRLALARFGKRSSLRAAATTSRGTDSPSSPPPYSASGGSCRLTSRSTGVPAMYEVNGRQYLVVCATNPDGAAVGPTSGGPKGYVAFALPSTAAAR